MKYIVTYKITGCFETEVDASNSEEAIALADKELYKKIDFIEDGLSDVISVERKE